MYIALYKFAGVGHSRERYPWDPSWRRVVGEIALETPPIVVSSGASVDAEKLESGTNPVPCPSPNHWTLFFPPLCHRLLKGSKGPAHARSFYAVLLFNSIRLACLLPPSTLLSLYKLQPLFHSTTSTRAYTSAPQLSRLRPVSHICRHFPALPLFLFYAPSISTLRPCLLHRLDSEAFYILHPAVSKARVSFKLAYVCAQQGNG